MEEIVNEIYKPVRKPKDYRKVVAYGVNKIWTMDLVFMNDPQMIKENDGYKYILFSIDVYSRFAFGRALKTKSATEVMQAIKSIMVEADAMPEKLYVDQGSEFYNKHLKAFLKTKNITIYSTFGKDKASIAERFNRTIKTKMFKKLLINRSFKWIDILPEIVKEYNASKHRGIQNNTPTQVYDEKVTLITEPQVLNTKQPKFKVGDRVRMSYSKSIFDKSFYPLWTYELFKVIEVKDTIPFTYIVEDHKGEAIKGSLYENELQKTELKDDIHLVEAVLKIEKTKAGKPKRYLVKWLGYKEPTWEKAESFEKK